jgi:hypothetical protein
MFVKEFSITDHDVVSFFKDCKDELEVEQQFLKTMKLGVMVLKSVNVSEEVEYVDKAFNNMGVKFSEELENYTEVLNQTIQEIFGSQGTFSKLIEQHFGKNGDIFKILFDSCRVGTPFYYLREEFKRGFENLLTRQSTREGEELIKKRTTLKGFDFQQYCENILSDIVRINGDSLKNTTTEIGLISNCKKGDFVVTLGNNIGKTFVFELKDVEGRISSEQIQEDLDQAKKNRAADYGIYLTKNVESLPKSSGWFQECNGSNLVCALGKSDSDDVTLHQEILCIAYKWVKSKLLERSLKEKKIDVTFVTHQIQTVKLKLSAFNDIIVQCGNIRKSIGEIQKIIDTREYEINQELNKIIASIESSSHGDQDK